ncbi:IclR family transcriptional regulator [Rhizobium mayense]|uniref:IclR family transcriptional regulator n=1 Tax=Rhizobium mayense TaxID=1312184 RepID=A0ABT7JQS2_9HYPH|nr:IclR family transcriptional regulator [Rhizobium mayense]MDL2398105.1 IclR family transcriptional regulator [Rhizobium mayense]
MNNDVKSAGRILELLELLARASEPLSLRQIVAELDYPKSSAFNLLQTLVSRGYAVREEPERYRLNEACRSGPGWTSGRDAQLIAIAQPILQKLRDDTGESTFLGVPSPGRRVKTIAKCVSKQTIRYDSELAGSFPSYCSAIGRVLLAALEPRLIDEYLASERLVKHTDHTVVDRGEIRRIIAETRVRGYSISDQEVEIGGSGLAAPVHDAAGKVVGALNVAVVTARFAMNRDRILEALLQCAREFDLRNGFKGEVPPTVQT